jgi:hypothetical protein
MQRACLNREKPALHTIHLHTRTCTFAHTAHYTPAPAHLHTLHTCTCTPAHTTHYTPAHLLTPAHLHTLHTCTCTPAHTTHYTLHTCTCTPAHLHTLHTAHYTLHTCTCTTHAYSCTCIAGMPCITHLQRTHLQAALVQWVPAYFAAVPHHQNPCVTHYSSAELA